MEELLKATGTAILILMAVMDIRKRKIPAALVLLFGCAAVLCRGGYLWKEALWGCLPGVLILFLNRVSRGQVGLGDGVMLMGTGLYLGGSASLKVFMFSLGLIFIYSCAGLTIKRLSGKSQLPFAPFYLAAYLGVVYL